MTCEGAGRELSVRTAAQELYREQEKTHTCRTALAPLWHSSSTRRPQAASPVPSAASGTLSCLLQLAVVGCCVQHQCSAGSSRNGSSCERLGLRYRLGYDPTSCTTCMRLCCRTALYSTAERSVDRRAGWAPQYLLVLCICQVLSALTRTPAVIATPSRFKDADSAAAPAEQGVHKWFGCW